MYTINELMHINNDEYNTLNNACDVFPEFYEVIKDGRPIISNKMFKIVIRILLCNKFTFIFRDTHDIISDDKLYGYIRFVDSLNISHLFLLNKQQLDILYKLPVETSTDHSHTLSVLAASDVSIIDNLEIDDFTDYEKTMFGDIINLYHIPENSESILISENTSRFSSALWFNEIQKKTITVAGLGGIGSYVCFLLSRMQPYMIYMYDDDVVEAVNMSGQLYSKVDLDKAKVEAMADMMEHYSDYYSTVALNYRFTETCPSSDIMICGFDNMESRKIYYESWKSGVDLKTGESRKNCLFIDGRLSAEYFQVYCITGDNQNTMKQYETTALFSDEEADDTLCSYKQTTYMANMIGSIIVNLFTNFVANEIAGTQIRELPFIISYDGNNMELKIK